MTNVTISKKYDYCSAPVICSSDLHPMVRVRVNRYGCFSDEDRAPPPQRDAAESLQPDTHSMSWQFWERSSFMLNLSLRNFGTIGMMRLSLWNSWGQSLSASTVGDQVLSRYFPPPCPGGKCFEITETPRLLLPGASEWVLQQTMQNKQKKPNNNKKNCASLQSGNRASGVIVQYWWLADNSTGLTSAACPGAPVWLNMHQNIKTPNLQKKPQKTKKQTNSPLCTAPLCLDAADCRWRSKSEDQSPF